MHIARLEAGSARRVADESVVAVVPLGRKPTRESDRRIGWLGLLPNTEMDFALLRGRVLRSAGEAMQLHEIEASVAGLDVSQGFELIYDLLHAYGVSNASITRLKSGSYDKSDEDNEVLWRDKVFYRYVDDGQDVHAVIDTARADEAITKLRPRFLIVRNREQIVAIDTRTSDTLDTRLADLPRYSAFFLPWSGIEKTQLEAINYADVKVAERMARLYDEIVKHNHIETAQDVHNLNIFFSRLLFCFFAEDTGVFPAGSFTNGIASLTAVDGSDTSRYLDALFDVLDTASDKRQNVPAHFADFGYVNGRLFSARASAPTFSKAARQVVIDCGSLNWSIINPDIFGSMMQAVVHPGQRESLGMHYTSVENIMKVIRPLFLDDLQGAFDAADTKAKLTRLHQRISAIKCFDPACGSGNFLVIAYKELRKLEHRILKRLQEADPKAPHALFQDSKIRLENFYGIEIDDFAHEIAILSLWLAKHQMNVEFKELFGHEIQLIPLRDTGNVVCANATRIGWEEVCSAADETYLLGNPPYRGGKVQSDENKGDFVAFFQTQAYPRNLDYISMWFLKGARYVSDYGARLGFVSTNSVCQGDHVGLLWPLVFAEDVEIGFAHESFRWTNSAKGTAGVSCVVIGLERPSNRQRILYSGSTARQVAHINAYLKPSSRETIVHAQPRPIFADLPEITQGNRPNDAGHLILTPEGRAALLRVAPEAAQFIKRYLGSREFLNGGERYCIWIPDSDAARAARIPAIAERLDRVRDARGQRGQSAAAISDQPHRFDYRVHRDADAVVIPAFSSERRHYIPVGYVSSDTIASNKLYVAYAAEPWVFGLVQSRMHMTWTRTVGGRLKTDYGYSGKLCYNTFPVPQLSEKSRELLTERTFAVFAAREQRSDKTLAQLYDPDKMPTELREAHQFLDAAVDQHYRKRPFQSDDERLELLFDMYEAAVAGTEQPHEDLEVAADA